MSLSKEKINCVNCNSEFETIWIVEEGMPLFSMFCCEECEIEYHKPKSEIREDKLKLLLPNPYKMDGNK